MKIVTICGAAVLVAGCGTFPTTEGFRQAMASYMGKPVSSLVSRQGPPQSQYTLPDGSQVLQYTRSSNMQLGGQTQIVPVTSNTYGTINNGYRTSTFNANTTTYQATQAPVYNVPLSCTVNFTISKDGIVTNWEASGNHCVAPSR